MTTANPQPVSTQTESSDDLIAELARLMAQEAPAAKSSPSSPSAAAPSRPATGPTVRIPGGSDAAPQPAAPASSNPFDFDFGFGSPKQEPAPAPVARAPEPEPVVAEPEAEADDAIGIPDDSDDPIGALIAAELDNVFAAPTPKPVAQAPIAPLAHAPIAQPAPRVVSTHGEPPRGQVHAFDPTARRREEADRFATSPVFGVPSRPVPTPPREQPADPMSEIEGLIGQAVRVELAEPAPRVVTPAARVPQPQRAQVQTAPMHSIDDTIREAAAATGAEVDVVLDPIESFDDDRRTSKLGGASKLGLPKLAMPKVAVPRIAMPKLAMPKLGTRRSDIELDEQPRRSFRPLIGLGVAATLLLAAGFGLWSVLGLGQPSGDAPVLTADSTPVKEAAPAAAAPDANATTRSVVFDEMAAKSPEAAAASEQLVSRDQTEGAPVQEVAALASDDETSENGLASRKVRTITVRPDGTIVSGDASMAGAEILPVDRPNVPELPGADEEASEMLAAMRTNAAASPEPLALAAETPAAPLAPAANAGEPVMVALADTGEEVPFPMPRPTNRSNAPSETSSVSAVVDSAPAAVDLMGDSNAPQPTPTPRVAAAEAPAPVTSANTAAAYVQLSSQRSEEAARSSLNAINSRYGQLFNGKTLEIQRVDLGEKGIYYRVRMPASTLNEAANVCANVKANGGDCFALNG